jgi:hypothetical protein
MRTFERTIFALTLGAMSVASPGFAFDGAPVNQDSTIPVVTAQPGTASSLKKAIPSAADTSLTSLQYAAEGGHPIAQWRLGRMYADGDGVVQDDLRAFEYFSRLANQHAEASPSAPQAATTSTASRIRRSRRTPNAPARCSPTPRRTLATPTRSTTWRGST